MNIGVVSDTHSLVRPQALEFLAGSDMILHAGDVGSPGVLTQLQALAPVVAIKGNIDTKPGVKDLPATELVEVQGKRLYLLHNIKELECDPVQEEFDAVIYGHSHKPSQSVTNGVLYLNPGSIGPRRFKLPVTAARLRIEGGSLHAEIHPLEL